MDVSVIAGVVGALGGVGLGSWLSDRSQRGLLKEQHQAAIRRDQQAVCMEFLAKHRQFRRFLLTEPVTVRLVDVADGSGATTPLIEGANRQWEAAEDSYAKLQILCGGLAVDEAARGVSRSVYDVARARAIYQPGSVPWSTVKAARDAEDVFAAEAQRFLGVTRRSS